MDIGYSETQLQRAILQRLALVPNSVWFRNSQTRRGKIYGGLGKGSADIIGCASGRFVAIEIKLPGEGLRLEQQQWNETVARRGGVAWVARSLDDIEQLVREL